MALTAHDVFTHLTEAREPVSVNGSCGSLIEEIGPGLIRVSWAGDRDTTIPGIRTELGYAAEALREAGLRVEARYSAASLFVTAAPVPPAAASEQPETWPMELSDAELAMLIESHRDFLRKRRRRSLATIDLLGRLTQEQERRRQVAEQKVPGTRAWWVRHYEQAHSDISQVVATASELARVHTRIFEPDCKVRATRVRWERARGS